MNADFPLISIITVVYNSPILLKKTIESVNQQTFSPFEFIIIDGNSTDSTVSVIKKYEEFVSYWVSEKDNGIYDAMNKGVKRATGEWILFLNAGDVLVNRNTLESVAVKLKEHLSCEVVYGDILVLNREGELVLRKAKEPCNMHRMYFCHQSAFIKRSLMKKFLYDVSYRMSADLKFFKLAYLAGYRFIHISIPLIIYDKSGISNINRNKGLYENVKIVKEIDQGWTKIVLSVRLYFTIYWRKLLNKR